MNKATDVYRDTVWWNVGFSAYWFATSYKWFILLFILLPRQSADIVGEAGKNGAWGIILGSGAVLAVVLPPFFARLTETLGGRWGCRQYWIAGGMAVTVLGCLVLSQAHSLPVLAVGFYLLQIGDQAGTASYAGMVADTVPAGRRDFASGILGALRLVGQIASIVVAAILVAFQSGYPGFYFAVAAVNAVCAALTLWTIWKVPPVSESRTRRGSIVQDWIEPFRSHDFRYVWLNRFVVALASASVLTYAVNYLQDMFPRYVLFGVTLGVGRDGADKCTLVLALTVALLGAVGAIVSSRIAEDRGRKRVLVVAGFTAAGALLPAAFVRDFNFLWVCMAVFGYATGAYAAADWALVSEILPDKGKSGTHMGVWHAADTVVQVFVGSIGVAIDRLNHAGIAHGLGYTCAVVFGGLMYVVSTFFVRQIRGSS